MSLRDFYSLPALIMLAIGVLFGTYIKSQLASLRAASGV